MDSCIYLYLNHVNRDGKYLHSSDILSTKWAKARRKIEYPLELSGEWGQRIPCYSSKLSFLSLLNIPKV